jgi:hypothetical protein
MRIHKQCCWCGHLMEVVRGMWRCRHCGHIECLLEAER